jgi:exosortase B
MINEVVRRRTPIVTQIAIWWPLAIGSLMLYIPTFFDLATGLWTSEAYAHGPIILCLSLWLIMRQWPRMMQISEGQPAGMAGWPIFIASLLFYTIGRSQGILMFETASFVMQFASILLILRGNAALKLQWFPFFFMLFIVPLPGWIVDAFTLPMKIAVSYMTEHVLFWCGYTVARTGVVLQIGQYQLLVADACAGLQTLLTLEALGLFYLNVFRHTSSFRNMTLAFLIVPISFTANVIRVITLTLITYHFGDEAGQGFLHKFAGIVLFISALLLIIGADSWLQWLINARASRQSNVNRNVI